MPIVNPFPTYDPYRYYNRAPRGYDSFYDLRGQTVLANVYEQQKATYQRAMENYHQKTIKIACVLLGHYQPEEISLEVDNEKITVHGQHQCEQEDGFAKSEFMRVFKLPPGIDPTTVTPHISEDGSVLVIESKKHVEDKANDGKFEAKLDLREFKPEEIKLQLRGNMLTVTGIQVFERQQSRRKTFSRCIKLPDDVDPSSVTSSLSKEGVLTIKASRDPARLSRKSSDDVPVTRETSQETKEKTTKTEEGQTAI